MTNKFQTSIVAFILIWLFISCQDQRTYDKLSASNIPLKLVSEIKIRSTIDNNWDTGNGIGIMMFNTNTNELVLQKGNYHYIATKDGNETTFSPTDAENTAYFPNGGAKVDIMGYYPYQASIEENFSVSIQTSDQSNPVLLDFLTSERVYEHSSNNPAVALEFVHRLAKLDITIDALGGEIEDELKNASLIISGTYTHATWSLIKNNFESKGETKDISIPVINGKSATAIIIPTTSANQIKFTLTTERNTYTANYTKDFEEGTVNTLHLHLKENAVTISSNIKPWEEGSGSGDTNLENIVTGLSLSGIETDGTLMLGTQEGTSAIHTNYDYNASSGTLIPALGEVPIYWDILQGISHTFLATFVPTGNVPEGHEKDILSGTSTPIPFGNSIALEMHHAMAQLVLTLNSDGSIPFDELAKAIVTISVPQYTTEINWNQINTKVDNKRTIIPQASTINAHTYIATIYPQSWAAETLVMSLTLGDKADHKIYTLYAKDIISGQTSTGNDFTLQAGDIYTLSAIVSKTEIGIQVTVDDNWKEVSGTGTFN